HLHGVQGVGGSNPPVPTNRDTKKPGWKQPGFFVPEIPPSQIPDSSPPFCHAKAPITVVSQLGKSSERKLAAI
ncbi:MAG: hypothetical protein P1U59_02050, partial [Alcanivorax sp.]|uniref:hypothetical protein n=1 Tax=Alcanivorax sp. TaxID=1872427 RepID=UPI002623DF64